MKYLIRSLPVILLVAAVACAIAGLTPLEIWKSWGNLIRRPDDVTPERYRRLMHVSWFFAMNSLVLAGACWKSRSAIESFLQAVRAGAATDRGTDESQLRYFSVLACAVFLAGCVLRLVSLFEPLAYDEAYTYVNFASRSLPEAIGDYNSTNNHLLNTLCMWFTTRLFGPTEWAIRWPVFVCGCLLPWAVMSWAREWLNDRAALVAGALTAVSPVLICYSVDARGYMYVALAAVVLDLSLARWRTGNARGAISAWFAVVLGFCAMPIMLYGVVASCSWYLLLPDRHNTDKDRSRFPTRLRQLAVLLTTAVPAVLLFYSPAYIFRGLMFLKDPIMRPSSTAGFLMEFANSWRHACEWWTDGFLPAVFWIALLLLGAVRIGRSSAFWTRWLMAFAAVFAINLVLQNTPPPRIYLHLTSWIFLPAAIAVSGFRPSMGTMHTRISIGATAVILIAGTLDVVRRPILFAPEERASFISLPAVIDRLEQELSAAGTGEPLLLAPLPCDLPAIFYLNRRRLRIDMNRLPQNGQQVWLITRQDESPQDALGDGLISLEGLADRFGEWVLVERFDTLTLYRSRFHSGDPVRPSE